MVRMIFQEDVRDFHMMNEKEQKIEKYLKYSQELGQIQ